MATATTRGSEGAPRTNSASPKAVSVRLPLMHHIRRWSRGVPESTEVHGETRVAVSDGHVRPIWAAGDTVNLLRRMAHGLLRHHPHPRGGVVVVRRRRSSSFTHTTCRCSCCCTSPTGKCVTASTSYYRDRRCSMVRYFSTIIIITNIIMTTATTTGSIRRCGLPPAHWSSLLGRSSSRRRRIRRHRGRRRGRTQGRCRRGSGEPQRVPVMLLFLFVLLIAGVHRSSSGRRGGGARGNRRNPVRSGRRRKDKIRRR